MSASDGVLPEQDEVISMDKFKDRLHRLQEQRQEMDRETVVIWNEAHEHKENDAEIAFNFSNFSCAEYSKGTRSAQCTALGLSQLGHASFVNDETDVTNPNAMRLTSREASQTGAVWYKSKVHLEKGFVTSFRFKISNDCTTSGLAVCAADGFAFVIHGGNSTSQIGCGGSALGFAGNAEEGCTGIAQSFAVEFDTWYDPQLHDPQVRHAAFFSNGKSGNTNSHDSELAGTPAIPSINDGDWHMARVQYIPGTSSSAPGRIFLYIDDMQSFVLSAPIRLTKDGSCGASSRDRVITAIHPPMTRPSLAELTDRCVLDSFGNAYLGFTAATGEMGQSHDVGKWSVCTPGAPCWVRGTRNGLGNVKEMADAAKAASAGATAKEELEGTESLIDSWFQRRVYELRFTQPVEAGDIIVLKRGSCTGAHEVNAASYSGGHEYSCRFTLEAAGGIATGNEKGGTASVALQASPLDLVTKVNELSPHTYKICYATSNSEGKSQSDFKELVQNLEILPQLERGPQLRVPRSVLLGHDIVVNWQSNIDLQSRLSVPNRWIGLFNAGECISSTEGRHECYKSFKVIGKGPESGTVSFSQSDYKVAGEYDIRYFVGEAGRYSTHRDAFGPGSEICKGLTGVDYGRPYVQCLLEHRSAPVTSSSISVADASISDLGLDNIPGIEVQFDNSRARRLK